MAGATGDVLNRAHESGEGVMALPMSRSRLSPRQREVHAYEDEDEGNGSHDFAYNVERRFPALAS